MMIKRASERAVAGMLKNWFIHWWVYWIISTRDTRMLMLVCIKVASDANSYDLGGRGDNWTS